MGNPYEIRDCPAEEASGDDECEACPVDDCRQDEMRIVWNEGYIAGLEAAALESDRVAAVHDDWARQPHALPAARAVATGMRILAHEIRNMKGNNQ